MIDMFSGNTQEYSAYDPNLSTSKKIQLMVKQHFMSLNGLELDYYGADSADNTFKVDGVVFKILEDPDDGYRSMLGAVDYTDKHSSIFFPNPVAKVRLTTYDVLDKDTGFMESKNQGYRLVDIGDGHIWLEFGTHNYDDYYPVFIFRHNPKKNR